MPLKKLDREALKQVITGYVSPAKYEIEKAEARESTTVTMRLVNLSHPYVKRYDHLDEETLARYARVLKDGFSFGAYEADRMIGVALAEPHGWNKSLWVWEFHVAEAHRGRGIGRRLMETLAEKGRAAGLRTVVCETQNTNVPAIEFYRRVGFTVEGIDLSYYTNDDVLRGEVAIFMKRRLI
jgi:ribosomal protein S18 acetylase RimI-like enzyme